jgi:hypothetical protein
MSNHDTPQVDLADEDLDTPRNDAGDGDGSQPDEGALNFKITVRKVQAKVHARGVLAE